jgi:porphobilinogen synthase
LRGSASLRGLVRETRLSLDEFVMPLFVAPEGQRNDLLPGMSRFSVDEVVRECEELVRVGVKAVILFGIPEEKDEEGSGAWDEDGIVQRALRALDPRFPELLLLTDVCLCEYTSHGHCGVLRGEEIDNDASLELIARTAASQVEAGADAVCPSDMMDGRSSRTRRNTRARSTDRFARPPIPRPRSATVAATRWIRPTSARRCASASSTSRKARTC